MVLDREVGEEGGDLALSHLRRVALVVEEHEAAHPGAVGELGAPRQAPAARLRG